MEPLAYADVIQIGVGIITAIGVIIAAYSFVKENKSKQIERMFNIFDNILEFEKEINNVDKTSAINLYIRISNTLELLSLLINKNHISKDILCYFKELIEKYGKQHTIRNEESQYPETMKLLKRIHCDKD